MSRRPRGRHGPPDGGGEDHDPIEANALLTEFLAAAELLGPRDRELLGAVIGRVLTVEGRDGAEAACVLIDGILDILAGRDHLDS